MRDKWISDLRKCCANSGPVSGRAVHRIVVDRRGKGSYTINRDDTVEWDDPKFLCVKRTAKAMRTLKSVKPPTEGKLLAGLFGAALTVASAVGQAEAAHSDKIAWKEITGIRGSIFS